MTVIRPNSISGVTSITTSGGDLSLFRSDGTTSDIILNNVTSGIITASTFVGNLTGNPTGSGANLTNLPAGNLTGNLPAISAANLTSIPAGNLTGTVADARISTLTASKLSGALPAISGANLTGISTAATSDFVKIDTATWTSAISSVTIDNLDTTTYKYFRLLFNTVPSDQGRRLSFRWRKDGSDQTGNAYDWNFGETYGSSTTTLAENANKGEVTDDMGNSAWLGCQLEFVIYPKSSAESGYQGNSVFWHGIHYENAGYVRGINGSLFYDGGTGLYVNGFKLYMNVGNLATGDYALYGVKR